MCVSQSKTWSSLPSCLPSEPPKTKSSDPISVDEWPTSAGGGVPETVGTVHIAVSRSISRTSLSGLLCAAPPRSTSLLPTWVRVGETRGLGRPPLAGTTRQFIVTRMWTSLRQVLPSWPPKTNIFVPTSALAWPTRGLGGTPLTGGSVQYSPLPPVCKT